MTQYFAIDGDHLIVGWAQHLLLPAQENLFEQILIDGLEDAEEYGLFGTTDSACLKIHAETQSAQLPLRESPSESR